MTDYTESLTDGPIFSDAPSIQYGAGLFLTDEVLFSDLLPAARYIAGAAITDTFAVGATATAGMRYHVSQVDALVISEALAHAVVVVISDTLTVGDVQRTAIGLTILSKVLFGDQIVASAHMTQSIAEIMLLSDELQWFYGGFLTDGLDLSSSLTPVWQRVMSILDGVTVGDTVTPLLQISVCLRDELEISDEQALSMIYSGVLEDGMFFSASYIDPGGGFTTWAINTRTSAITEYQNYAFNSYAQLGNHYLGASDAGLYVLDGALDDTASIIARVKSGSAEFAGSRYTAFDAAYLGCRVSESGNTWLLKLHAGDGREYVYEFRPLNRRTTKVFMGKGLRARYFSWELITAGENFDLDVIEFVPIGSKRRV